MSKLKLTAASLYMMCIKPVYTLLILIFISMMSCNGQLKTSQLQAVTSDKISKPTPIGSGQPKIFKTQGSNQYDNIHCAIEDKAGNLWFGTTGEGVYRFDGKLFTQFTKNNGLASNAVWSILEDKGGDIWFGTTDGICRYDGKNIHRVPINGNFLPTITSDNYYTEQSTKQTVWSIFQDKTGKIWFGTGDGVYCYNGSIFTRFLDNSNVINKEGLHLKMVDCILEDHQGNIWFASGMPPGMEGVCRYDGKSISSFKPNGDSWIRNMIADKNGNIWFPGRQHGNFLFDGKSFSNFMVKTGIGNVLLCDKLGNKWFSGEEKINNVESVGGVWSYDGKAFKNFTLKDGMGKYFVFCMLEDSKGNIWFGTRNTGLYKYDGASFTDFSEKEVGK